jgi:1-deoxy-D-xylulose-5-phosphate reductoisomerase
LRPLFNLRPDQIEVIVHPQSIVHSIVQFEDGSMKAQMGLPDMKLPIQYALSYPSRLKNEFPRFDFLKYPELTFSKPDLTTFRNLALAYEAMNTGGTLPCAMNAANEVAVSAFLKGQIGFLQISDIIEETMSQTKTLQHPRIEDYIACDEEARKIATERLSLLNV